MPISCSPTSLVEFAYTSKAASALPASVLSRLARQCWAHNVRAGLTGELRHDRGEFHQILEGPWAEIMTLAARILTDPRHTAIAIRSFRAIEARRFESWTVHGLGGAEALAFTNDFAGANVRRLPVGAVPAANETGGRAACGGQRSLGGTPPPT